jgi:hypothetical protein
MLLLDSPRWAEIHHAYGPADDIPPLLRELQSFPTSDGESEPWFTLWSSLCHQGDVYPASFAAVPHIVGVLATDPVRAGISFFHLPTCIEIARYRNAFDIPAELQQPYFDAIQQLPSLVAATTSRNWDEDFLSCALAAIAAGKGFPTVAEAAMELSPETAEGFLEWYFNQ